MTLKGDRMNADQKDAIEEYQSHLDDALKSIQEAVATLQSQILIQGDEDLTTDEAYRLSECYAAIARLRYGAWMNEP